MGLGEAPAVKIRWTYRKSETCDHLLVDFLEVESPPADST
jgi:hypothetical protein